MIISLIAAIDERRGIGYKGKLPWRLSADLKRFRSLTMGHHIVVGRKTFESIGKPLPGRETVIVTRNPEFEAEDCLITHSLTDALELARQRGETEAFICGGAELFNEALRFADRLYLTLIHATVEADRFFPEWEEDQWSEEQAEYVAADEKNQYASTFKVLTRKHGEVLN